MGFDNQIYIAATASNMKSLLLGTLFMAKSLELFLNQLAHLLLKQSLVIV